MKTIGLSIAAIFLVVSLSGCAGANGKSVEGVSKPGGAITLGAPVGLRLVIVPNGFKLSWKPAPEDPGVVTGYEIVRSDLASGPFTKVATVNKGVFEYIDTTESPEIIYYYKARAVAGNVSSPYSNTVTGER